MTDQTMSHEEVNRILDACRFGDHLTVTRTNGGDLTSVVSGPVLCAPGVSMAVGIDLLDGEPHLVRREDGSTFGQFVSIEVQTPRSGSTRPERTADMTDTPENVELADARYRHRLTHDIHARAAELRDAIADIDAAFPDPATLDIHAILNAALEAAGRPLERAVRTARLGVAIRETRNHDRTLALSVAWAEYLNKRFGPIAFAPDPLDEDDHRDRADADGDIWVRNPSGCWHPSGTRADLSASQGESGAEERGEAKETAEPLLCVECEHLIDYHTRYVRCEIVRCPCTLQPSDIARKLIEQAVEQAGGRRG